MTKKILTWITPNLINFALSKSIKQNSDYELYSIIDAPNNLKKFFKKQNIVDYSKFWFFHDAIKKDYVYDPEYLEKFEKKYGINLWLEINNERNFTHFNKFHSFTKNELLGIVEQECKFFEKIFDEIKPNFYIESSFATFHHDHIFSLMCKYHNVKTLFLHSTRISSKKSYISEFSERVPLTISENNLKNKKSLEEILDNINNEKRFLVSKKNEFDFSLLNQIKSLLKFIFTSSNNYKTHYTYYGRYKLVVLAKYFSSKLISLRRKSFVHNNSVTEIDTNTKFIYYPLHIEEESAMLIGSPFYLDQIDLIRKIAMSLPVNYELYVKESPVASARDWRKIDDYKKILEIPNVKFIHPSVDPKKIYPHCSLVITVTGTAALESLYYKKPSIIFSSTNFSNLSSVKKIDNIEQLPTTISASLKEKVDSDEVSNFYSFVEQNSFDFDISNLTKHISDYFYFGGMLSDIELDVSQVENFLNIHEKDFALLASEFLKKIN